MQNSEGIQCIKYLSKPDQRKVCNNLFIKNLPINVTDEEIFKMFSPYGNISSLFSGQSPKDARLKFYNVSYALPNEDPFEYGLRCTAKAIEELHGMEYKG